MELYIENYDLKKDVYYSNTTDYRKCLRELFHMKCIFNPELEDIDEET